MPIKKVFETEKAVYRLDPGPVPRPGGWVPDQGGYHYFWFNPIDNYRIYEEYFWYFRGLFTIKNPNYPGEFEIHLVSVMETDNYPSWSVVTAVWDGKTGKFLGMRPGVATYTTRQMFSDPNGTVWSVSHFNYALVKNDLVNGTQTEHYVPWTAFGANIGAFVNLGVTSPLAVDPAKDLLICRLSTDDARQLSVCRFSTGDFLYQLNLVGAVKATFIADPPIAYAVEETGSLTAYDYVTGEVKGVLHTGLAAGIWSYSDTAFTWDPFMRRVLYCHNPGDTLPDGDCNTTVQGFFPVPLPTGVTPPIPLRAPQKGKTVPVFSRAYGGVGEGIAGQDLTYTLEGAGTVSPGRKATENNGTAVVQLTSTAAGPGSITSQTTVP